MKIPVILVTGFLGSGKTTLLRRTAERHPGWRMLFLVNEFAASNIDGDILGESGTPAHGVVGGSLFCECKAGEFVKVMGGTVLDEHRRDPLRAVIIETSGIADPGAIGAIMRDFSLEEHFRIHRVITIVAPDAFLKLVDNLPNIAAQVRTSDLVAINKCDLADAAALDAVEARIRGLNPGAEIVRTRFCDFDLDTAFRALPLPAGDLSTCEANPFSTETVAFPRGLPKTEIEDWLNRLPPTILRVKGYVHAREGWFRVERTTGTLELSASRPRHRAELVLIAHDDHAADLNVGIPAPGGVDS